MEMMKFIFHTEYTTEDLDKMATIKNLVIDQGTTFVANTTFVSDSGTILDLAGYTVTGQLQRTYQSTNITASFNTTITNNTTGKIQIQLASNVTAKISAGRYVYGIFGKNGDFTIKINEGIVTVNPSTLATGRR